IEAMIKDDTIAIRAVPNPLKLNYRVMAVIALGVELSRLDEVCEKLVDIPNISYVSVMFGKFDVILFAEYRDFETLFKLVREQMPSIKGIREIDTFIIADCKKGYMRSFKQDSLSDKSISFDEIDEKLINELRIDGRATYISLANKLGISSATISRRISSLVKNHAIQITVVANPTKLGHHVTCFLGMQVELTKINEICAKLSTYTHIPLVITLMNGYHILAAVTHINLRALLKFITSEISRIDGILNIETLVRGEFKKRTYLGFDLKDALFHPDDLFGSDNQDA
ncbi:MAG: Lrp/AsnC ligand binding domain-containing protein, partial [Dehalococcoidia bacterium]